MTSIRHSSGPKIDSILNEVFRKWLAGSGRMPVMWTTFVKCLRNVKLNRLADTIEEEYISEPAKVGDTKPKDVPKPVLTEAVKDQKSSLNSESNVNNGSTVAELKDDPNASSLETVKSQDSSTLETESSDDPITTAQSLSPSTKVEQSTQTASSDEDQGKFVATQVHCMEIIYHILLCYSWCVLH